MLRKEYLVDRNVAIFIDNDSAREALIRGYSPALRSAELIAVVWSAFASAQASPWFDRVPGPSNLADGPSRPDFSCYTDLGFERVDLVEDWEQLLCWRARAE